MPPSLPTLLTELGATAITALGDAGLVVADTPIVYHGPIPDEAECVDGRVTVWWQQLTGSERFPTPAAVATCGQGAMATVVVRWSRCWPIEPQYEPEHSTIATELADGAWRLFDAFAAVACGPPLELLRGRGGLALSKVTPRAPLGGVAAVDVTLMVRPGFAGSALSSDPEPEP